MVTLKNSVSSSCLFTFCSTDFGASLSSPVSSVWVQSRTALLPETASSQISWHLLEFTAFKAAMVIFCPKPFPPFGPQAVSLYHSSTAQESSEPPSEARSAPGNSLNRPHVFLPLVLGSHCPELLSISPEYNPTHPLGCRWTSLSKDSADPHSLRFSPNTSAFCLNAYAVTSHVISSLFYLTESS